MHIRHRDFVNIADYNEFFVSTVSTSEAARRYENNLSMKRLADSFPGYRGSAVMLSKHITSISGESHEQRNFQAKEKQKANEESQVIGFQHTKNPLLSGFFVGF
ncbi:hypothetical protein [Variovorax sp. PCZ-1]|uniref:hypothetical protein n=1 Tax=Variovorax sp. PCZ-1 TaxID=2835533 RepID=UPI001BCB5537|nr:hypothetical protein [Variovorax sp. PCZ-1]MBS7806937.1 hypothetical protein [Variovorax sp. PCZ-1]